MVLLLLVLPLPIGCIVTNRPSSPQWRPLSVMSFCWKMKPRQPTVSSAAVPIIPMMRGSRHRAMVLRKVAKRRRKRRRMWTKFLPSSMT
uniref:Putative secreted peptide n=1 Tax=Anopheles braziliensis TaxID=58242 RepID=A0A2M3ZV84_9DIPT